MKIPPKLPEFFKRHGFRIILLVIFLSLAVLHFSKIDPLSVQDLSVQTAQSQKSQVIWSEGEERNPFENARQHFKKHGAQFSFRNEMEYIKAANEFVTHPPVGTLTIIQRDGDTVYYHPDKNWFAVKNKQGAPRTFFRPDPAIHGFETNLDYFKHQEYRP